MQINLAPAKTYATRANVEAAIAKYPALADFRYMIVANDAGRFFPIFIGAEAIAVIHIGFTVVG